MMAATLKKTLTDFISELVQCDPSNTSGVELFREGARASYELLVSTYPNDMNSGELVNMFNSSLLKGLEQYDSTKHEVMGALMFRRYKAAQSHLEYVQNGANGRIASVGEEEKKSCESAASASTISAGVVKEGAVLGLDKERIPAGIKKEKLSPSNDDDDFEDCPAKEDLEVSLNDSNMMPIKKGNYIVANREFVDYVKLEKNVDEMRKAHRSSSGSTSATSGETRSLVELEALLKKKGNKPPSPAVLLTAYVKINEGQYCNATLQHLSSKNAIKNTGVNSRLRVLVCSQSNLLKENEGKEGVCDREIHIKVTADGSRAEIECIKGSHTNCVGTFRAQRSVLTKTAANEFLNSGYIRTLKEESTYSGEFVQSIARKASDGADVSLSQAYRLKSDMRENVAQDRAEAVFSQVALFREMVDKNRYSAVVEEFKLKGMEDESFQVLYYNEGNGAIVEGLTERDKEGIKKREEGHEAISLGGAAILPGTHLVLHSNLIPPVFTFDFAHLLENEGEERLMLAVAQIGTKLIDLAIVVAPTENLRYWERGLMMLLAVQSHGFDKEVFTGAKPSGPHPMLGANATVIVDRFSGLKPRIHALLNCTLLTCFQHFKRNVRSNVKEIPPKQIDLLLHNLAFATNKKSFEGYMHSVRSASPELVNYLKTSETNTLTNAFTAEEMSRNPEQLLMWSTYGVRTRSEKLAEENDVAFGGGLCLGYPAKKTNNNAESLNSSDKKLVRRLALPQIVVEKSKAQANVLMEQLSAFIEEGEALLIPSVQEKFAEEKLAVKNVIFLTRVDPVTYELQESDGFGNMETGYVVYEKMKCSFHACTTMAISKIPCRHFLKVADHMGKLDDPKFYSTVFPPFYLKRGMILALQRFRYHPFEVADVSSPDRVLIESSKTKNGNTNPRQARIPSLGEKVAKDGKA